MVALNRIPDRLRRVSTSGDYIPQIDGLRFIAVFMVLIAHLDSRVFRMYSKLYEPGAGDQLLHQRIFLGDVGVELFFAISGFIIAFPFLAAPLTGRAVDLRRYFKRRLTRLEPPYILSLTGIFIFLLVTGYQSSINGAYGSTGAPSFAQYLASVFYLHGFFYGRATELNPPAWSLELEIRFYIIAPALLYLWVRAPRLRWWLFPAVFLGSVIASHLVFGTNDVARKTFLFPYLSYFLLGIWLCHVVNISGWFKSVPKGLAWDFAGLAGLAILYLGRGGIPYPEFAALLGILLLFLAAFRGPLWIRVLSNAWISAIGGMCYTIYLLHLPLMQVLVEKSMRVVTLQTFLGNLLLQSLIIVPIILLLSVIFFLAVEKPCMYPDWPSRLRSWVSRTALPTKVERSTSA